jgi:hypothetical protein
MFDKLEKMIDRLDTTSNSITRARQLRNILWIAEMCLKYKKKPKEIIELLKKSTEALKGNDLSNNKHR